MMRFFATLSLTLWAACASSPAPKPDPFEAAEAVHMSPDGLLKLTQALPGEVTITKSAIGYVVGAKGQDTDLTCVVGGLAQVDAGALLYRALRNTVDAWVKSPLGDGFKVDDPWTGTAGDYPVFGLRVQLRLKDGSVDAVPALVIAHHAARIYCVDSKSDDRERLLQHGARIALGLQWKGTADHRLPGRSLLHMAHRSGPRNLPVGYYEEGLGRGSDGNVHYTETFLFFQMGSDGQEFRARDVGFRQVSLPDGTLDEMTSAWVENGRMAGSATFHRLETGGYRITGVAEGKPVEETMEGVKLTSHGVVYLWLKDQPKGASRTFQLPSRQRPWTKSLKVTVEAVLEDGARAVVAQETWKGETREARLVIGQDALCRRVSQRVSPDTILVGTPAWSTSGGPGVDRAEPSAQDR
ncbi:MAG: hypothetical protein CMH55_00920 [Myxococcales bacterium]|nr:hypothetical protein [Myxococcales bacterium]